MLGPYSLRPQKQRLQHPTVPSDDPDPSTGEHPRTNDWVQVDGGPLHSLSYMFTMMEKGNISRMREVSKHIHKLESREVTMQCPLHLVQCYFHPVLCIYQHVASHELVKWDKAIQKDYPSGSKFLTETAKTGEWIYMALDNRYDPVCRNIGIT